MNRKKIFAVIITVAAVINSTACQSKEEKYHIKTKDAAYYDMSYNVYENGLLYTVPNASGTQACFLDYETMNGVPLCNKPNCTHSDSSCVSNLCAGSFMVPVIYHDYVYWFASNYEIVDSQDGKSQTADMHTKCMRARLDTGLTETFAEIDGVYMQNQIDLAIVNDTMYIIGSKEIYQDETDGTWGGFSRSGEQYLYSINLDSAEVQNYGLINDAPTAKYNWSYGASLWSEVKMEGIYHDKLYLYYRYVKDPQIIIDYLNTDWVENGSPRNDIPWIIENKCLDLKTGEITVSDLPYAWCIGENHYIYEENEKFFILDEDGEKTAVENMYDNETYDFTFVNNKLWKGSINHGFDVKTDEEFSISDKYADKDAMIMDFVDNQYVVRYVENNEVKFDRVSEQDFIGGAK